MALSTNAISALAPENILTIKCLHILKSLQNVWIAYLPGIFFPGARHSINLISTTPFSKSLYKLLILIPFPCRWRLTQDTKVFDLAAACTPSSHSPYPEVLPLMVTTLKVPEAAMAGHWVGELEENIWQSQELQLLKSGNKFLTKKFLLQCVCKGVY